MATFLQKIEAVSLKVENTIKTDISGIQPLIITAINYATKLDALLRTGVAVTAATLIPSGEADRELILVIVDEAIVDLKAVQSARNYNGILQALATGITEIIHGKKLSWSQYVIEVEQVFAQVFGSAKPVLN